MSPKTAKIVGIVNIALLLVLFSNHEENHFSDRQTVGILFLIAVPLALLNLRAALTGIFNLLFQKPDAMQYLPSVLVFCFHIVGMASAIIPYHQKQRAEAAHKPPPAQTMPSRLK